jgi:transmembrane sensor
MVFRRNGCGTGMKGDSRAPLPLPQPDDVTLHPALLDRVLANECTATESAAVDSWCAVEGGRGEWIERVRRQVTSGNTYPEFTSPEDVWSCLRETTFPNVHGSGVRRAKSSARMSVLQRKSAYSLLALVMTVLCAIFVGTARSPDGSLSRASSAHRYATTAGQRATVTLVDGSRVVLGPSTTLHVVTVAPANDLDVRVTGQALFTVTPRSNRMFRVRTSNATALVLGTTFLVRQYETDRRSRVIVMDGRVALRGVRGAQEKDAGRVLTARDLGVVDDSGTVQLTPSIAVDDYTGWTRGELVFRKTLVRDIIADLGRAYDVDIRLTDSSLAARTLSWRVPIAERSLSHVLGTLNELLDTHPVQSGRVITLVPGRLATPKPNGSHPRSFPLSESQYGR